MMGGKSQGTQAPTALGTMTQASTYGMAIPDVYGLVRSPFYAIYAANIRKGNSGKKGKKASKKGQPPTYVEDIDFLVGTNPAFGILRVWNNNIGVPPAYGPHGAYGTQTFDLGWYGTVKSVTISDPHFLLPLSVVYIPYTPVCATFADYGDPGPPRTICSAWEYPLWNAFEIGPDPSNPSVSRWWPYVYKWSPADGPTIALPSNPGGFNLGPLAAGYVKVYYVIDDPAYWSYGTLAYNRLTFEPQLGDGPSGQPIVYPMFFGCGSDNLDLGGSALIPALKGEVRGRFGMYPLGDCDPSDIFEDIIKSGVRQAAYDYTDPQTGNQSGCNCYDLPGWTDRKYYWQVDPGIREFTFDRPIVEGTVLLGIVSAATGTFSPSCADTGGNTWVDAASHDAGDLAYAFFYSIANATAAGDVVSCGVKPYHVQLSGLALVGVDSFDNATQFDNTGYSSPNDATITTTQPPGQAAIIFALIQADGGEPSFQSPEASQWSPVLNEPVDNFSTILCRRVYQPGTYGISGIGVSGPWRVALVAFKQQEPSNVAFPLGNIIDDVTMQQTRNQCRATGLTAALTTVTQKKGSDVLGDLCDVMNAAPVWSGDKLKVIPKSEVSELANGAIYVAPTAAGPLDDLDDDNGDFLSDPNTPPITVTRVAQSDLDNVLQLQINNRLSNYDQVTVSQPSAAGVALQGSRKAQPKTYDCIYDMTVARKILMIMARNAVLAKNQYAFKLPAKRQLYEAMDLVTITNRRAGIVKRPVRFTSIREDAQFNLTCQAIDFVYGLNAPNPITATSPGGGQTGFQTPAGDVNAPVFLQPPLRLTGGVAQLWAVLSGGATNYGGCQVWISTDGGSTYNLVDAIIGNGITGVSTADWPLASDPDTTNDLPLDLTESLGSLSSYAASDRDQFLFPCYIAGGITAIPYELLAYNSAVLTSANHYTLKATGAGNELRRDVFSCPNSTGVGVDHPSGSRFAFLDPSGAGSYRVNVDPEWINQTLHFKFPTFNIFGGALQSLSDATDYTYTVLPTGASPEYLQSPAVALSQPDATHVTLAAVSEQFASNLAEYNAQTVLIPGGAVGSPTWLYVTITDVPMLGGNDLPVNLELTQANVGVAGRTYVGAILVTPTAVGYIALPGGWPPPQGVVVGP